MNHATYHPAEKPFLPCSVNRYQAFLLENRLNFAPKYLKELGSKLLLSGVGMIAYSKTCSFGASILLAGGILTTILGTTSLHAASEVDQAEKILQANFNAIWQKEKAGDFATALKIAKLCYERFYTVSSEEFRLIQTIMRLEKMLLKKGYLRLLFDDNFQPRQTLVKLLKEVGMEPLSTSDDAAIIQINRFAQANLLRQGERWEKQAEHFEKRKVTVMPLLKELGFVEPTTPHFKNYQGALVHGALLPRVRLRLHYLIEQWKTGVRFNEIYFLSGERPLELTKENENALLNDQGSFLKIKKSWIAPQELPKTECEMVKLVWEQSEIPQEMRESVKVHFINAPMKQDKKTGKLQRPTTDDTIETWLKVMPLCGRYLAVTNAPYAIRQDIVVRSIAHPPCYEFDTIASGASEQEKVAIYLDELARVIFQFKKIYEKSGR